VVSFGLLRATEKDAGFPISWWGLQRMKWFCPRLPQPHVTKS